MRSLNQDSHCVSGSDVSDSPGTPLPPRGKKGFREAVLLPVFLTHSRQDQRRGALVAMAHGGHEESTHPSCSMRKESLGQGGLVQSQLCLSLAA